MIDRVEVLQDGASTIYGSDAIAGVVNIITKTDQRGFAASAQVGAYLDQDDGWTQNYQLSWGNGDSSSTKIVVGGNYVKANGVLSGDRAISAFPNPYSTSCTRGWLLKLPADRPLRRTDLPWVVDGYLYARPRYCNAADVPGRLPGVPDG